MNIINFIKNIFGSNKELLTETMPINETQHADPKFDNLTGYLFKKEKETNPEVIFLDVRTGMEVNGGKIENAINIDFMSFNFAQKVANLDKSKTYLVYCRSGNRSGKACQIMHKMGFDVRNLLGGIGEYPK
jgi:phage shock protein E